MRGDLQTWLIAVASCLAFCAAMPNPEPEPDVNVNIDVDVNKPEDGRGDINVDVNVNIEGLGSVVIEGVGGSGDNDTTEGPRPTDGPGPTGGPGPGPGPRPTGGPGGGGNGGGNGGTAFTLAPGVSPPPSELNSFTAEQKAKVESALADVASGTCTASGGTCSCTATKDDSFYYEKLLGARRFIVTSGIPNHDYETGQQNANPNNACPHWTYLVVPAKPVNTGTFTSTGLGAVGIAVSGGYFYNHLASPQGSVAVVAEGESFDTCNGHSDPTCKYHYHKNPTCLMSSPLACNITGYMFDGFPVYSYCAKPGTTEPLKSCYKLTSGDGSNSAHYTFDEAASAAGTCDLDLANGYDFTDGGYAYVFSEDYPFISPGYYGTQAQSCYIS